MTTKEKIRVIGKRLTLPLLIALQIQIKTIGNKATITI